MILRELAARYDLKFNDRAFKKADKSIAGATSKLKELGGLLIGGIVARGFFKFIDGVRGIGDEIDKTSVALGVNRQALQEWRFAAGLGGVQAAQLNVALKTLQKAALDAADGAAEYKDEFDRMGIVVTDTNGVLKSADVLLTEMADGLQTLETDTERVATASNLMGRAGSRLLPLFAKGSKGIREMRAEAHELGGVLGDDLVDASVELTDDTWRLQFAWLGIKGLIARGVMPLLTRLVRWITKISKATSEWVKDTNAIEHALILLGIAGVAAAAKIIVAFAAPLLIFLQWAVILAAIFLIFDDVLTLFRGGTSVVGRFIDKVFGLGSAQEFVENHRAGVKLLGEAWNDATDALANYARDAESTAALIVDQYSWAFNEISLHIETLVDWIETLEGVTEGFGQRIKDIFASIANLIPGVKLFVQAARVLKFEPAGAPEGAGEELKRRQRERATGRGIAAGVERGPGFGETLPQRQGIAPTGVPQIAAPQIPQIAAPQVTVPVAQGGASVTQRTNVNINVRAGTGAGAREIGAEVEARVRSVLKKENRAAMQAVKQQAGS